MKTRLIYVWLLIATFAPVARATDEFTAPASWSAPAVKDVKFELDNWLKGKSLDAAQQEQIAALWPDTAPEVSPSELLDQTIATLAAVDPAAKEVALFCRTQQGVKELPQFAILGDNGQLPIVRNNLRLLYGSWLAQHDLHEEALEQFGELAPNDVIDPASLLFHRSVCFHRLRDKEQCLPAIAMLLENENSVPRRFRELAKLMQADMEPLKPDTLDEIARMMDSIRRRLDVGRVGTRVRQEEDDVIAKLDKMIDELEKKRDQQDKDAAAGATDGSLPTKPLEDSKAAGGKGPGNVDPKKLENHGAWGNLPPRDRQEALQQISKELPAHYREAIEEYFRKIAREGVK